MSSGILELTIEAKLTGPLAEKLVSAAAEYGQRPIDLLADIIETVLRDDLISAVLDK